MLHYVLDDDPLEGPYAVSLRLRPPRTARPVPVGDPGHMLSAMALECQLWGGAATPIIPVTQAGLADSLYSNSMRGADIDRFAGVDLDTYDPDDTVEVPDEPEVGWDLQFAPVVLAGHGSDRPAVNCPVLDPADPWRGIYAACFGTLPSAPDPRVLHAGNYQPGLTFERFLEINWERVAGSASDLFQRLEKWRHVHSPRTATMHQLGYGWVPDSGLRRGSGESRLPRERFWAADAGPNVIVVCTPGDVRDLALLWNLRVAHGDRSGVPLGVLADSFTGEFLEEVLRSGLLSRQGIPEHQLYVTSTSIDVQELVGTWSRKGSDLKQAVAFVEPRHLADVGPAPSRGRQEVATWTSGRTSIVPITPEDRSALTWARARDPQLRIDLEVLAAPFPRHPRVRTGLFTDFYAGSITHNVGGATAPITIEWPTRMLMLKVVAQQHDLIVEPSEPGVACMTLLRAIGGVHNLIYLAHAPLLALLSELAERQGNAWAKAHNRSERPIESNRAPTIDDLPDARFEKFRLAIGGRVDGARAWMAWAERHRLVVKGFPLCCEGCGARQWVPISGYRPPIVCVGCAEPMEHPFPREQVEFTYRLSEALRRVYEHDAVGHLLVLRYLTMLFSHGSGSALIGAHPGLNVSRRRSTTRIGEADVLLLHRNGTCSPVEVKRSFGGVSPSELRKLDSLADALDAPWQAVAITDYAAHAPQGAQETVDIESALGINRNGESRSQLLLTYDHLLEPSPVWTMGSDPFSNSPMTSDQISSREGQFVELCRRLGSPDSGFTLENSMLYERKSDP